MAIWEVIGIEYLMNWQTADRNQGIAVILYHLINSVILVKLRKINNFDKICVCT